MSCLDVHEVLTPNPSVHPEHGLHAEPFQKLFLGQLVAAHCKLKKLIRQGGTDEGRRGGGGGGGAVVYQ